MPTHVKEPTPDAVKKSAANEAQSLMDQADDHAQDLVQDNGMLGRPDGTCSRIRSVQQQRTDDHS